MDQQSASVQYLDLLMVPAILTEAPEQLCFLASTEFSVPRIPPGYRDL